MAPSATHLSAQLRQIIWYHLDNDLLDNALFHAGRLQGIDARNHDNIHLLALCQLRVGQLKAACESSRSVAARAVHIGCSYVFAQACLGLKNFTDGIVALQKSRVLCDGKGSSSMNAASVISSCGLILILNPRQTTRSPEATNAGCRSCSLSAR